MDERLRVIADHQFGPGAGEALFRRFATDGHIAGNASTRGDEATQDDEATEGDQGPEIRRTGSGRPQQIIAEEGRLVSFGVDGRFTLGLAGGRRLHDALDPPSYRVVVGAESESFVREGKNAFAKFVRDVDPRIRPGDEVLVVGENDDLFGVGRAELPADAMEDFETGVAVQVREGLGGEAADGTDAPPEECIDSGDDDSTAQ